jgi:phosphoribosyl-AMP cyclohydrolase
MTYAQVSATEGDVAEESNKATNSVRAISVSFTTVRHLGLAHLNSASITSALQQNAVGLGRHSSTGWSDGTQTNLSVVNTPVDMLVATIRLLKTRINACLMMEV